MIAFDSISFLVLQSMQLIPKDCSSTDHTNFLHTVVVWSQFELISFHQKPAMNLYIALNAYFICYKIFQILHKSLKSGLKIPPILGLRYFTCILMNLKSNG